MDKEVTYAPADRASRIARYQGIFLSLMEEEEGRKERLKAGIDFKSIQLDEEVKISYIECGKTAKTIKSDDKPRDQLKLAMECLSYHWTDELGPRLYQAKGIARSPRKITLKYDRKSGQLTDYSISGVETVEGASWIYFTSPWIPIYEKDMKILDKIFDEAYLYIIGERKEENLFKQEEAK